MKKWYPKIVAHSEMTSKDRLRKSLKNSLKDIPNRIYIRGVSGNFEIRISSNQVGLLQSFKIYDRIYPFVIA